MPRAKKTKSDDSDAKNSGVPGSVRFATALLVILAVGGSLGVNYLKTPRGAVFLADRGAVLAYARVQRDADRVLKRALETKALRRNIRVIPNEENRQPIEWDIPCPEKTDLLEVNVALTDAIRSAGLVVRRSEEFDDGRRLVVDVGTQTLDTHRLTLRRLSAETIARAVPPAGGRPKLALVIDDLGYAKNGITRAMLDLDLPLTVSILPGLRYSRDVLELARSRHRCAMLHLPMQSEERERLDVEPVTVGMNEDEITTLVRRYADSLPGIDGVNNHQGSLATADPRVMKAVTGALAGRDLFFLDSLTSPKSLAYNAAVEGGLRAVQNSLFIDDATERRDDVAERLRELVEVARARGSAIGIGHPHPWTFEALRDNLDYLENAGVELVTVCELAAPRDSTHLTEK
jgi:polysaccharide deacetylase 2 family uncharacterized protein YibQ